MAELPQRYFNDLIANWTCVFLISHECVRNPGRVVYAIPMCYLIPLSIAKLLTGAHWGGKKTIYFAPQMGYHILGYTIVLGDSKANAPSFPVTVLMTLVK